MTEERLPNELHCSGAGQWVSMLQWKVSIDGLGGLQF